MNRYDGRFIDFTLSKDFKHRAYSVIISTRIFNNSCGVCMLEYSCETPRFSHLMTHDSNCCLLDDPRKSLNWKNKIHITSLFFSMIDRPCLLSLWKQNPPIWLKQMLTKYWRGFQICSEPGLLVCWWCAQNSCLFSRGWKQSERSSNLSLLYSSNDNFAPLCLCAMMGHFVVFLQFLTSS